MTRSEVLSLCGTAVEAEEAFSSCIGRPTHCCLSRFSGVIVILSWVFHTSYTAATGSSEEKDANTRDSKS